MFLSKFSPVDADVLRVQNKALVIFTCGAQAPGELAPRVYGLKVFLTLVVQPGRQHAPQYLDRFVDAVG